MYPSSAPGPDLGADVIHDRNAHLFCLGGQQQVKIGVVDKNQQVWALSTHSLDQHPACAENVAQVAEDFGDTNHRQAGGVIQHLHPCFFQFPAAHAAEAQVRVSSQHSPSQIGAMQISRCLTGHDHNP